MIITRTISESCLAINRAIDCLFRSVIDWSLKRILVSLKIGRPK